MAVNLSTLSLEIDSSKAKQGAAQFKAAVNEAGDAALDFARQVGLAGGGATKSASDFEEAAKRFGVSAQWMAQEANRAAREIEAAAQSTAGFGNAAKAIDPAVAAMERLHEEALAMNAAVDEASRSFEAQVGRIVDALSNDLSTAFSMVTRGLDSMIGRLAQFAGITGFSVLASKMQGLDLQIKAVTTSAENFAAVQTSLKGIAARTNSEYESTVGLYVRIIRSSEQLGATQKESLVATEAITNALLASGASGQQAKSVILQMGQALSKGVLAGDELRSILSNAPVLAQQLAKNLGDGTKSLSQLAAEGKILSRDVFDALLKSAEELNTEGQKLSGTVGQAMTNLANQALFAADGLSRAVGFTQGLTGLIDLVARNMEAIYVTFGLLVGAALYTKFVALVKQFQLLAVFATILQGPKGIAVAAGAFALIGGAAYVVAGKMKGAREEAEAFAEALGEMDYNQLMLAGDRLTRSIREVEAAREQAANSFSLTSKVRVEEQDKILEGLREELALVTAQLALFGGGGASPTTPGADEAAAKAARAQARMETEALREAEHDLNMERMLGAGQFREAAEAEADFRLASQVGAVAVQVAEGEMKKAVGERLKVLYTAIDTEQRLTAERERAAEVARGIYAQEQELSALEAESSGDTLAALSIRHELERKFALEAIRRSKDLNDAEKDALTTLYERISAARVSLDLDRVWRAQAAEKRDLEHELNLNILRSRGLTEEADKADKEYRRNAYARMLVQRTGLEQLNDEQIRELLLIYDKNVAALEGIEAQEKAAKKAVEIAKEGADKARALYENLARGLQSAFATTFTDIFDKGVASFADFFNRIKDLFIRMLAEMAAAALTKKILAPIAASLGLAAMAPAGASAQNPWGDQIGNADFNLGGGGFKKNAALGAVSGAFVGGAAGYSSGSALLGGLSGAATGFAVGGPIGGIVGGVVGVVGGLFGAAKKAREMRKAWEAENKAFGEAFDDFILGLRGGLTEYAAALKEIEDSVKEASEGAIRLFRTSETGKLFQSVGIADLGTLTAAYLKDGVDGVKNLVGAFADTDPHVRELIDRLEELGEAGVEAARLLKEGFIDAIEGEARDLGGLGALNVLDAIEQERKDRLKEDDTLGTGLSDKINEVADAKIRAVINSLGIEEFANILPFLTGDTLAWAKAAYELLRETEAMIEVTNALALARERERTMEEMGIELLQRRAELSGDVEMMRLADAAAVQLAYKREKESLEELLAAGLITQEFFDEFAAFLGEEMADTIAFIFDTSADAAYEAERAFDILRQNMSALSQEAEVFGYAASEVAKRVDELYGFAGKSDDQLREMFTKYAPGSELTAEQVRMNDAIVDALRTRAWAAEDEGFTATDEGVRSTGNVTPNGTVYTGPVTVQVNVNVKPDELRDADRTAQQIVDRVDRLLAGRATLSKAAGGNY